MNETNETYRELKQKSREYKLQKQAEAKEIIELLCGDLGVDFQEIKPYHFRLSQNGFRVDIFPQRNKYCILNSNQRGKYKNIQGFMYSKFK